MMRQLIAGNWKMNGLTGEVSSILDPLLAATGMECELLVCPPATLLMAVADRLRGSRILLGGQDCHANASGAHTGDISAPMLRDAGAGWVIVGHSERRADHAETDIMVQAKARAAHSAGLGVIVCVGETEQQRQSGQASAVVKSQLTGSLPAAFSGVVAYEPIWAIGTGRTPTEEDVAAMHAHIRATLAAHLGDAGQAMRILYGGSVKPSNAASLLALPEVGGALVGGASLKAEDFLAIARASQ
jgi:triosephosphate isomerase